jgi:lysine N6-hydroxylase
MMMNNNKVYDFAAIGAGPFNIGLACLTQPITELDGIFLDKREGFNWHPGMLLQDTTLQVPFLADLVTLADPTSPFSFLNYLKEKGRIYSFYIRENFKILRNEYNQYCQWAIQKLPNIHFNTQVEKIVYDDIQQCYAVSYLATKTGATGTIRAKKLVLGTGTVPYIPAACKDHRGKMVHSAAYLDHKRTLQTRSALTIVGSGQSAAEIYYDLLQDIDTYGYELHWITRSPRFFPLEYSKLTLEMTSPEYVDYYYHLPPAKRDYLMKHQKHLYKGINNELIGAIFDLLYAKRLVSDIKVSLRTNSELKTVSYLEKDNSFELEFFQEEQEKRFSHTTEGVVLATGYHYTPPAFLEGIASRIKWDDKGRFDVNRNYTIDKKGAEIFVQNAELHTHGLSTPDLGMGCYRNSHIIKELTGKDYYAIEKRIAFQQFSVTEEELIADRTPELI